jgi:hypothetical protein
MLVGVMIITSCQKELEIGETATKKMAGEWFLRTSDDGGQTWGDYTHFSTYNTASNSSSEMWIDDLETFWQMKGKVNIDLNNKTFSGTDIQNEYYESTFTITDGKILEKAAKASGSKTVTDSLYFKATFSDDPGTEYILAGYRKTGFLEDEH